MADEYSISARLTMDTSGYDSGVKKAQSASKKLSKNITDVVKGFGKSGLSGAITSAGLALGGIGLAVGTAVKAIKGITKALGECAEAYKVQLQAERALDTAISNSPFVSGSASKALKDYASQLQKVSNLGDEEIIPQMTQLIATGRTEAEVMKIIATASDMSASGAMSFDQAVTQLNSTLNGNIGRLGQQNAELKALSQEELQSGKAVDILAEKYKGLASATVDTKKQLQNAIGDLKETFGSVFENAMTPMRKFFTELIQGWADARKAKQEYEKSTKDVAQGTGDIEDYQNVIAGKQKELEDLKAALNALLTDDWGFPVEEAIRIKNEEIEQAERELEILKAQLDNKIEQQEIAKKQAEEENKRIETEKTVADLKGEYLEKMAEQERKWKNIKDVTGEQVSNEEKIKFYQDSLVELMTKAGGQITTNNQLYKDQIAIIQKLQSELEPEEEKTSDTWVKKIREQAIERLKAEKEAYDESVDLEKTTALERYLVRKDYNEKIYELEKEQLMAERELALKSVEGVANEYEEKARIIEYYNKEVEALAKKQGLSMEKEGRKSGKSFAEGFSVVIKEIKNVMSKVIGTMKSVLGGAKNIFKKLFDFNPDDALTNLLIFEDKILTFFVETLPKLPQFFASALQSISVMLDSILNSGGFEIIGDIIANIVTSFVEHIPQIIKGIMTVVGKVVEKLEPVFDKFIPGLVDVLVNIIGQIMKQLPKAITIIIKALSNLIQAIVKALPSLLRTIIPNLLKAVLTLIQSLLRELPTIITALIKALPQIISAVIEGLVEFLSNLKGKDIAMFVTGVIKAVSQIAIALITNIGKIVAELIPLVVQIIVELIKSIPEILKGLLEGVWDGIKWIGEKAWEGIKNIGEGLKGIGKKIKNGFRKLFGFATGTNDAPKGLALVGEAGPELVKFRGGEQVLNARNTQKALASAGGNTNNFNVTFNNLADTSAFAMIQQLKAYNRQMAINGII